MLDRFVFRFKNRCTGVQRVGGFGGSKLRTVCSSSGLFWQVMSSWSLGFNGTSINYVTTQSLKPDLPKLFNCKSKMVLHAIQLCQVPEF